MGDSEKRDIENSNNRIKELESQIEGLIRYKKAVKAAGFDIWENNFITGDVYGTNANLFRSLGYSEDELPKSMEETFAYIHPDDLKNSLELANAHFKNPDIKYQAEMRIKAKDGSWTWTGSSGSVVSRNDQGQVSSFMGLSFNIDAQRTKEDVIKELAYTDSLTKLGNRRILYETGAQEIERSIRYNHPLSLIMLDIDDFKDINDTYGHLTGDDVLIKLSDCLMNVIRQIDIKIRYGGDEFVVVLLESTQTEAWETAERLRYSVENMETGVKDKISVSMGITDLRPGDTLDTLLARCDNALYESKNSGKNRITLAK